MKFTEIITKPGRFERIISGLVIIILISLFTKKIYIGLPLFILTHILYLYIRGWTITNKEVLKDGRNNNSKRVFTLRE